MDHLLKVNCFRKLCSTLSLTFYKMYVNFPPFKDILITQSALLHYIIIGGLTGLLKPG